jgi:hypothetical protein
MLYSYNIPLRNTFGGVGPNPIYTMKGFDYVGEESKQSAMLKLTMQGGQIHFLEGNKIFSYLWRNLKKHYDDKVTLVVPGLREIYKHHIDLFPEEANYIHDAIENFEFYDVYGYGELIYLNKNVNEYQLIGTITPYDVLHIPVVIFIAVINQNLPLVFKLNEFITINMSYTNADLYDLEYQRSITSIEYPYESSLNYIED